MTLLTSDQDTFEQPQDDEVVLSVKNVSKRFCRDLKKSLFYGIQDIAGEVFGARRKDVELRKGEFWALNDVSLNCAGVRRWVWWGRMVRVKQRCSGLLVV